MSYSVMVYGVRIDDLQDLIGSRQTNVVLRGDAHPDVRVAFEDLVSGEQRVSEPQMYVDALEHLCRQEGRYLDNGGMAPTRVAWFEHLNDEVEKFELGFDLFDVVYGGSPVKHPKLDSGENVGGVSLGKLREAMDRLGDRLLVSPDRDVDQAFFSVENWIHQCVQRELDLVGFFY